MGIIWQTGIVAARRVAARFVFVCAGSAWGAILVGCTAVSAPEAMHTAVPAAAVLETAVTPVAPTGSPLPTAIPSATATARPTETATATRTPDPTFTFTPTNTPTVVPTVAPSPTVVATPITPIGQLTPATANQTAAVVGRVTAVDSFSRGYKFTLDDGSGQVVLLMWENVYDDCWDAPHLNLGATVWALGQVGEFEGELQLVPSFGGHVKVRSPAAAPPALHPIGALGNHIGERVTITGQIDRVESGSHGVTLYVADDTGEIAVFIWHNTLQRILHNQMLATPGTRVRVVGVISLFRGHRQLVPTLPYDVEVLP